VYKTDRELLELFFHPESRCALNDIAGLKRFGIDSFDKLIKIIDEFEIAEGTWQPGAQVSQESVEEREEGEEESQ
jgi:hypothetical protein